MFHFVTYVPINGRLYELDGLKEGPVDHGKVPEGTDWLDVVIPVLMERMAKYQAGKTVSSVQRSWFRYSAPIPDRVGDFETEICSNLATFSFQTNQNLNRIRWSNHALFTDFLPINIKWIFQIVELRRMS